MRNFTEILDLLGQIKTQLRIDDPMNHYDKIIEIENHLLAEQNKQTDLVGYIHKDDLGKLLSDNAGNHLTVGMDTRQAWPTGPGESNPYDWLVAVYTRPAQAAKPPSAQSWELDEESCKFLADMITADPDQITRVGFHLGYAKDDDGKLVHGFSVYEAEYPEEGVHTLVETKTHPPAQPNCGACPGDGSVCEESCGVANESPAVAQEPVGFNNDEAWKLAQKVRIDLDRKSFPGIYMNIVMESINRNYIRSSSNVDIDDLMLGALKNAVTAFNSIHDRIQAKRFEGLKPSEFIVLNKLKTAIAAAEAAKGGVQEISDREWAAKPSGLREGCDKHVPGVGDL